MAKIWPQRMLKLDRPWSFYAAGAEQHLYNGLAWPADYTIFLHGNEIMQRADEYNKNTIFFACSAHGTLM